MQRIERKNGYDHEQIVPRHRHILSTEQMVNGTGNLVGGKAKNLAELTRGGFPVPVLLVSLPKRLLTIRRRDKLIPR